MNLYPDKVDVQVPSFLGVQQRVLLELLEVLGDDTEVSFRLSIACLDLLHKDSWVFLPVLRDQGVHLTIEGAALLVASLAELLEVPKIDYHQRDIPHFVMDICFASCRRSLDTLEASAQDRNKYWEVHYPVRQAASVEAVIEVPLT